MIDSSLHYQKTDLIAINQYPMKLEQVNIQKIQLAKFTKKGLVTPLLSVKLLQEKNKFNIPKSSIFNTDRSTLIPLQNSPYISKRLKFSLESQRLKKNKNSTDLCLQSIDSFCKLKRSFKAIALQMHRSQQKLLKKEKMLQTQNKITKDYRLHLNNRRQYSEQKDLIKNAQPSLSELSGISLSLKKGGSLRERLKTLDQVNLINTNKVGYKKYAQLSLKQIISGDPQVETQNNKKLFNFKKRIRTQSQNADRLQI